MKRPRVLLADDHQMLADALKSVIEPRCEVVGIVNDGRALLEAAAKLQPDIVVPADYSSTRCRTQSLFS
jgi:DNA-binding NarL/FixJ family response regulator